MALAKATLARTNCLLRGTRKGIVLTHEDGSESESSLVAGATEVIEGDGCDDEASFAVTVEEDDEEGGGGNAEREEEELQIAVDA